MFLSRLRTYVLRSALRNRVRTVLTLLGTMVTVAVFCFLASIESSVDAAIDRVAQTTLLVVGEKDQW